MPIDTLIKSLEKAIELATAQGNFQAVLELSDRLLEALNLLPEPTFTPERAAEILNVSPATLGDWCRSGDIPCIQLGSGKKKYYRFTRKMLERELRRRTKAPNTHFV